MAVARDGQLVLDVRTVFAEQEAALVAAVGQASAMSVPAVRWNRPDVPGS